MKLKCVVSRVVLLCAAAGLLISVPSAEAADKKKVERLAKECEAGREKSCRKLRDIATKDKKRQARKAAVERLSDQILLAQIAKEDSEWVVRSAAVSKLEDPALLADIAQNDETQAVRRTALRNEAFPDDALEVILRTSTDWNLRRDVVREVSDEVFLVEIATTDS